MDEQTIFLASSFSVGILVGTVLTIYVLRLFGRKNIELVEKLLGRSVGEIGARVDLTKSIPTTPLTKPIHTSVPNGNTSGSGEFKVPLAKDGTKGGVSVGPSIPDATRPRSGSNAEDKRRKRESVELKPAETNPSPSLQVPGALLTPSLSSPVPSTPKKEKSTSKETLKTGLKEPSASFSSKAQVPEPKPDLKKAQSTTDLKQTPNEHSPASEVKSSDSLKDQTKDPTKDPTKEKKKKNPREGPTLVVFDEPKSSPSENGSVTSTPRDKNVIKEGWVELGTKVGGQKLVWNRRYFLLTGCWLSYYKNEQKREDQCLGYINLAGCEVSRIISKKEDSKPRFVIFNKKHRIFHKHGPNPDTPPCSKKHYVFHRRSKKCRLRVAEQKSLESWIEALKTSATETRSGAATPFDSEDDMYDAEEMVPGVIIPSEGAIKPMNLSSTTSTPTGSKKEYEEDTDQELEDVEGEDMLDQHEKGSSTPQPPPSVDEEEGSPITGSGEQPSGEEITTTDENREGLLKLFMKAADITKIALPVTLNEPVSFLQRMCELVQYAELLDKADQAETSIEAMMYVATFAISMYQSIIRIKKPFNPYLGETFEYVKDGRRFVAEQVSHHPPVGASHFEDDHFEFWQEQGLRTKFKVNSIACDSTGRVNLKLKKFNHHYCWEAIKTTVHNIIFGSMWIDHYGDAEIKNYNTGETARLEFKQCGWFNKGRYEVSAWILDSNGKTRIHLEGKWNESVKATIVNGKDLNLNKANLEKGPIWINTNKVDPPNDWNLPSFCMELLHLDPAMQASLPQTDSRLRPDRLALQEKDIKRAGNAKFQLEEKERAKRRAREAKGEIWNPKYFVRREDDGHGGADYLFNGLYWKEREQNVQKEPQNQK